MWRVFTVLLSIALVALASGCRKDDPQPNQPAKGNSPSVAASSHAESTDEGEPWIARPPSEWPQLVLTNEAEFEGHTPLEGASSFLIRNREGHVFAATAKHLIGEPGGVKPELTAGELNKALRRWEVYPRTKPEEAVELGRVAVRGLDSANRDWLVMTLKDPSLRMPAYALSLRKQPVSIGETVYMVGCPYTEPDAVQNVYKGKVTKRIHGDYWRFDIGPPVELPGFSGAPILDGKGRVVGVVTVWFDDPKMSGKKWLEAGGEDVGAVFEAVNRPSDATK